MRTLPRGLRPEDTPIIKVGTQAPGGGLANVTCVAQWRGLQLNRTLHLVLGAPDAHTGPALPVALRTHSEEHLRHHPAGRQAREEPLMNECTVLPPLLPEKPPPSDQTLCDCGLGLPGLHQPGGVLGAGSTYWLR